MDVKLTTEKQKRFDDFLKITFLMSEDELLALDEQTPMNYEMFQKCADKLWAIGSIDEYNNLLNRYPDYLEKESYEIEQELEENEDINSFMPDFSFDFSQIVTNTNRGRI